MDCLCGDGCQQHPVWSYHRHGKPTSMTTRRCARLGRDAVTPRLAVPNCSVPAEPLNSAITKSIGLLLLQLLVIILCVLLFPWLDDLSTRGVVGWQDPWRALRGPRRQWHATTATPGQHAHTSTMCKRCIAYVNCHVYVHGRARQVLPARPYPFRPIHSPIGT
jgi:hypothetical protein